MHADEQLIDDPCPPTQPVILADATGAFVLHGDMIYFVGATGVLSRVGVDGGAVSELSTDHARPIVMAADDTHLYWATDGTIIRMPIAGGAASQIALGYGDITHVVVDDTSVVWASSSGLERWTKADEAVTHLDDAREVLGLGAFEGVYYFSDHYAMALRRTPPAQTIADAMLPGPLVVDASGVYYYDIEDRYADHGGAIRLVPRDGGTPVTTASKISAIHDLAADATDLLFPSIYAAQYRIQQVSRFGGDVRTLACGFYRGQRMFIAVANEFVYWSDDTGLYRTGKYGVGAL